MNTDQTYSGGRGGDPTQGYLFLHELWWVHYPSYSHTLNVQRLSPDFRNEAWIVRLYFFTWHSKSNLVNWGNHSWKAVVTTAHSIPSIWQFVSIADHVTMPITTLYHTRISSPPYSGYGKCTVLWQPVSAGVDGNGICTVLSQPVRTSVDSNGICTVLWQPVRASVDGSGIVFVPCCDSQSVLELMVMALYCVVTAS